MTPTKVKPRPYYYVLHGRAVAATAFADFPWVAGRFHPKRPRVGTKDLDFAQMAEAESYGRFQGKLPLLLDELVEVLEGLRGQGLSTLIDAWRKVNHLDLNAKLECFMCSKVISV